MRFNSNKIKIEEVLYNFYEYIVYLEDGTEFTSKKLYENIKDKPAFDYIDYTDNSYYNISDIPINLIVEVYNNIPDKNKYDKIFLIETIDENGHRKEPRIVGSRIETDLELSKRKEAFDKMLKENEDKKLVKKQKVLENKKKKLEQLQKELIG